MNKDDLNARIVKRGKAFFAAVRNEKASLFNKADWTGKVMDWCMQNEDFKIRMFRFVDVFPALKSGDSLQRHLREYFGEPDSDMPEVLRWGAQRVGMGGRVGTALLNRFISGNIRSMANQFIVGETPEEAIKNIVRQRKDGFAFVIDVLGEATLSEADAEAYVKTYLNLLEELGERQRGWKALGDDPDSELDWGHAPKINIAVKPTALYSQTRPQDLEGSAEAICQRLRPIMDKVVSVEGFLCIDMESSRSREIILEVYRRLRLEYRDYPHFGLALQAYLKETERDLDELIGWARKNRVEISIRLVKGAYWDYETVVSEQNSWEPPVFTCKAESDVAFERLARTLLENHAICHLACGSHNIRSIAAVQEMALELEVPESRYEFQVLYGMAEPIRKGLLKTTGRVRLYAPFGKMVPGMAYLVRRLLENTANDSFLRQSFAEGVAMEQLLTDPAEAVPPQKKSEPPPLGGLPPFRSEPAIDFTRGHNRRAFRKALDQVRSQLGRAYPLLIGGQEVKTKARLASVNPANPEEIVGYASQAGVEETEAAIDAARKALDGWRDTPPEERAACLVRAAQAARQRLFELSAWQVLEIGKQWDQAYGDVTEAIDFLEYYAREMIRLGKVQRLGCLPGEENSYFYEPKGVAAVIAPWNFPLAISCGMTAAAIVAGNPVVFKPSNLTPVIGHQLVEIFAEAGLPPGVFNYLPGASGTMGDTLVGHPDISLIAFTGSLEVGLHIVEQAAKVHPGQAQVKKVIAEMGGKNAMIIDDDADIDEAIPNVLASAFAFQGQKCSACSRVIVLDEIHDLFVERLVEAARALSVGPPENPAYTLGAVCEEKAVERIRSYIALGKQEGTLLYQGEVPETAGYYVPITIIGGITPDHRLANEEIFGPVLAVMKARDFDQALDWANAPPFALTGGIFSRSPDHLLRASREFRVGNLYLNRSITGALVGRQPFGGSYMSGLGTKAGGPDYLLHFMDPRCVTENTMRRGFAPKNGRGELEEKRRDKPGS